MFKRYVKDVLSQCDAALAANIVRGMQQSRNLWLCVNFMKECSACVYAQIQHSQATTVGSFRDKRVHKPRIHRVWDQLCSLRQKSQNFVTVTDMGPTAEALVKKETDGCRWYSSAIEQRHSLEKVLTNAAAKAKKYVDLLTYAQLARVFDPRQRSTLPQDMVHAVCGD